MKVLSESATAVIEAPAAHELVLPQGIIGFPHHHRAELLYKPENLPLLWMRLHGPDILHFVVVEPANLFPGYEPELFDEDAAQLEIADSADAMLLNIVTLNPGQPSGATVNLIGPIIVNRRTRIGRQRVLANHTRYSAAHRLLDPARAQGAATVA
jgi:flagellar assembly factor FliW